MRNITMTEENNILEDVSEIRELLGISDHMKDPLIDEALKYVVKLSVKSTRETIPAGTLSELVIKLQALAGEAGLKAKYYQILEKGPEATIKKNFYYAIEDRLDKIVMALKHAGKNGNY